MKKTCCYSALLAMLLGLSPVTYADGCIKGAAAGAAIGHLKHHAVLGAVGGCVVGHHLAAKAKKEQGNKS